MNIKNMKLGIVLLSTILLLQISMMFTSKPILTEDSLFPFLLVFAVGAVTAFKMRKKTVMPHENSIVGMKTLFICLSVFLWQSILPNWYTYLIWFLIVIVIFFQNVIIKIIPDPEDDDELSREEVLVFNRSLVTVLVISILEWLGFARASTITAGFGAGALVIFFVIYVMSTPDEKPLSQMH